MIIYNSNYQVEHTLYLCLGQLNGSKWGENILPYMPQYFLPYTVIRHINAN